MLDTNEFLEFRHVHLKVGDRRNYKHVKSVTFLFRVDHDTDTIEIAWALCGTNDKFSRKTGREVAWSRFEKGEVVVGEYLRCFDLVQNAVIHLSNEAMKKNVPASVVRNIKEVIDTVAEVAQQYDHIYGYGFDSPLTGVIMSLRGE